MALVHPPTPQVRLRTPLPLPAAPDTPDFDLPGVAGCTGALMQWTLRSPSDARWPVLWEDAHFAAAIASVATRLGGLAALEGEALTDARVHLRQRCVCLGGWRGTIPYGHLRFADGAILVAFLHDVWWDD